MEVDDNKLVTDSINLAKMFKKRLKNVLQSYDKLKCSPEFNRLKFQPVKYYDEKGELRRSVKMTKDVFTMLAMGFTGAMAFKEAYINAFNAMSELITRHDKNLCQKTQALIARELEEGASRICDTVRPR